MAKPPPTGPRLSKAAKAKLAARHDKVIAKVLAAENIAMQVLGGPTKNGTRFLLEYIAGSSEATAVKRAVYHGVHAVTPAVRDEFSGAVRDARDHARRLSRLQAEQDLELFKREAVDAGLLDVARASRVRLPIRIAATSEMDAALAAHAGGSMAQQWAGVMLGQHAKWKREGGSVEGLSAALRGSGRILEPKIHDHAMAHSFDPYADEHRATWGDALKGSRLVQPVAYPIVRPDDMFDSGPESGLAYGWGEGIFDVWSAVLDRKTCPACAAMDGHMVPAGKGWPGAGRPPMHPRCRCVPMALFVPEAVSRKLPGIQQDYSALKEDVRDYMRGRSLDIGQGQRNALPFIQEALGGSSSKALTQRLSERQYFQRPAPAKATKLAR